MIRKVEEIEVKNGARLGISGRKSGNKGTLLQTATFTNGAMVAVPINKDRSVKWFDDSKLIKKDLIKDKAEKYLLKGNGKDIKIYVLSHSNSSNYIASISKIVNAKVEVNNFLTISDPNDEDILTHIPYVNLLNVTINILSDVIITYKYESYQVEVCIPYSVML